MNPNFQPKILIVDDDEIFCKLLGEQLQDDKFNTELALDGPEAIQKIKQNEYNLVILNQNMMVMNGDETLVEIKKYDSSIPVIMVSAQSDPAIIVKCIKLGADDYHTKPYDYDELLTSIIKYLKVKK